jgi:hypothetical protein
MSQAQITVTKLKLAASTPICTHEELAALEFAPESHFVGVGQDPTRMETHEEFLRQINIMSRFAIGLLGKTKQELIDTVRNMDEDERTTADSCQFLEYLTDARGKAEALLNFLTSAEIRHACAMANVYAGDKEKLPPIPGPSKHHR